MSELNQGKQDALDKIETNMETISSHVPHQENPRFVSLWLHIPKEFCVFFDCLELSFMKLLVTVEPVFFFFLVLLNHCRKKKMTSGKEEMNQLQRRKWNLLCLRKLKW